MEAVRLTAQAPAATAAPADRKYLLERVDDAAVVQMYADGFAELLAEREDAGLAPVPGRAGRARHLLRPAVRPQPGDARRARGRAHAQGRRSIPATLAEIERYTKLFWINSGPFNNLTARKFVLTCTPGRVRRGREGGRRRRRAVPAQERRDARSAARPPPADVLRPGRRSDGHQQDAAERAGHPRVEREQPVRRPDDEGPRGVQGGARAQLAPGQAGRQDRRRGVSRRTAATPARSRRSSSTSRRPSRLPPSRWRRRSRRSSSSTGPARRPTARRTTSRGSRTRPRPWTRSTGSSRCTSTRAASRAAGKASSST